MKHLAMMCVVGLMAVVLGACDRSEAPPMPDANTNTNEMMSTELQAPAATQNAAPSAGASDELTTAQTAEE